MSRFLSVAGNADPALVGAVLLEGLGALRERGLMLPAIVDAGDPSRNGYGIAVEDWRDEPWPRGFKRAAGSRVAAIRAEALRSGAAALASAARPPEGGREATFFVLPDPAPASQAAASAAVGATLFIAESASGTASAVYGLMRESARLSSGRFPLLAVAVSGCRRVEEAAAFFCSLRGELAGLLPDDTTELCFAGGLAFDPERAALAYAAGSPYGRLFPGDSFAGAFLYVGRRIAAMLDEAELEGRKDPAPAIESLAAR
jgi:hypothetical protein